jgi:Family of unknown function (DUF6118)
MENADPEDVELEIEAEPDAETSPVPKVENDPAAEAFARLEGELTLMRRAVQHLAAERADIVIPDYSTTLAEMTKQLAGVSRSMTTVADHPAMQMTPDSIGHRIAAAAESARRTDHDRINAARVDLKVAAQDMRSVTAHARTAAAQRLRIIQAAGGGMLAGMLLWSFLPGTIARTMPENWLWPERMAAKMVNETTVVDAGIHLIRSENPKAWAEISNAAALQRGNSDAIKRCKSVARKAKRMVKCEIRVGE